MDRTSSEAAGGALRRAGARAVLSVLVPRVRSIVAESLPESAALLDESIALDWQHSERRRAHLDRMSALVEAWTESGHVDVAVAVHQTAALCDPEVVSPETLLAAAIETAALAHAVTTTGMADDEMAARWERDVLAEVLALP